MAGKRPRINTATLEKSSSDVKKKVLSLSPVTGMNVIKEVDEVLKGMPGIEDMTEEEQGDLRGLAETLKKQIEVFKAKTDSTLGAAPMTEQSATGRQSRHLRKVS